jgi:hypothetical protein
MTSRIVAVLFTDDVTDDGSGTSSTESGILEGKKHRNTGTKRGLYHHLAVAAGPTIRYTLQVPSGVVHDLWWQR